MKRLRKRMAIFRENATFAKDVIYKGMGARWSVNPFVYAWRTRFLSIELMTEMGLWILKNPDSYGIDINDEISEWRHSSTVGNVVTRNILLLAVKRRHFTTADVEVACGNAAKRTAIKKMLTTGVQMGLLEQDAKWNYKGTNKLIKNAFWRTLVKLLDPDIVRFARYVVMWDDMRRNAEYVGKREDYDGYRGNYLSMHEQLYYGEFDDEIFEDGYQASFDSFTKEEQEEIAEFLPRQTSK